VKWARRARRMGPICVGVGVVEKGVVVVVVVVVVVGPG